MGGGVFFNPDVRFSFVNNQVLTRNSLKHMYVIGLMLSKFIGKSKIYSMIKQYKVNNQGVQKEISAIIEKNAILNEEIAQLSNLKCDCENENTTRWSFPILCTLLVPLFLLSLFLYAWWNIAFFGEIIGYIGSLLNCFWP
jgi:hypothetical protein